MGVALFRAHCRAGRRSGKIIIVLLSRPASPLTSFFVTASLAKSHIVFESRFKHDVQNGCLMTIDGTDYSIQQKGVGKKGNLFGSHKYGGKSAL